MEEAAVPIQKVNGIFEALKAPHQGLNTTIMPVAIILETASELGHKQGVAGRAGRQVVHQGLVLPILGRGLPNLNHVTHHELVIQLRHRVIEFDRGIICMCIHGPVAPPPQQILAGNGEVITARHVLRQLYIAHCEERHCVYAAARGKRGPILLPTAVYTPCANIEAFLAHLTRCVYALYLDVRDWKGEDIAPPFDVSRLNKMAKQLCLLPQEPFCITRVCLLCLLHKQNLNAQYKRPVDTYDPCLILTGEVVPPKSVTCAHSRSLFYRGS